MNVYRVNSRFLGVFFMFLMFGVMGVVVEVDAKCIDHVQSDTRECEHVWERLELPSCMQVDAEYEFADYGLSDFCEYQIALRNDCSESYVFEFECKDVKLCPKGRVLESGGSGNVVFGFDSYGKNEVSEAEIAMLFTMVEGQEEGDGDVVDEAKMTAGVFTGSASGEVVWGIGGCQDEIGGDGCQVASLGRPVGGFVGFAVIVLGLIGVVWRRRVVG